MTELRDQNSDMIVVLPLGAHEQHGPHLPFDTDTIIAEGIVARVGEAIPAGLNVNFLPVQPVGYSIEHMDTEGTQSLAFSEAVNQWIGIGENLHAGGIRKLVMLNAHGGNSPLMTIVATELRVRLGMLAVATSWTRFGLPEGLITPEEKALDIHGGFIETSVMPRCGLTSWICRKRAISAMRSPALPKSSNICAPMARMRLAGKCTT